MTGATASRAGATAGTMILPPALAQFIASCAGTSTNAISAIATDLHANVAGAFKLPVRTRTWPSEDQE